MFRIRSFLITLVMNKLAELIFGLTTISIVLLHFTNAQVPSSALDGECKCSMISESAKIKCFLSPVNGNQDAPNCSVIFEQANSDVSHPHTKCIGRNTFSAIGEYRGQLRKVFVHCDASYPMDVWFNGMLPHQSIGIASYRYHRKSSDNNGTISALVVSMDVEPEITGKYSIYSRDHVETKAIDFYIFAENGPQGPYLLNAGKKPISPKYLLNKIILPCRPFNPSTNITLFHNGELFSNYGSYHYDLGFVLDLSTKPLNDWEGEYECRPNKILDQSETSSSVFITVSSKDINMAINGNYSQSMNRIPPVKTQDNKPDLDLALNVTGKWASCTAYDKTRKDYRLVNMRSRNPLESSLKKLCFIGEVECLGKREGSFNRCYSSPQYCKSVDFKEGGGLISCFSRKLQYLKDPNHYLLGLDGITYINPDPRNIPIKAIMDIRSIDNPDGKFYTRIAYKFTCTAVSYLLAQPIMLDVIYSNGSRLPLTLDRSFDSAHLHQVYDISSKNIVFNNYKVETVTKFGEAEYTEIACSGFAWNSEETIQNSLRIRIEKSQKPFFAELSQPASFILGQTNELECDAVGLPKPSIEWQKDGEKLPGRNQTQLVLSNTTESHAGTYSCTLRNQLGQATTYFHVEVVEPESGPGYFVTVGVPLLTLLISAIICIVLIRYYRRSRTGLSQAEINEFLKGIKSEINRKTASADPNDYQDINDFISGMPYSKEYEIMDGSFHIDETSLLGSGAYGMVYKGTLEDKQIAIKTLKRNADVNYLRSLLTELKVMIYLKDHPNIVNLVGANTKHLKRGLVYVMVELCPLGSLENYLREHRVGFVNEFEAEYCNGPMRTSYLTTTDLLKTSDLLRWSIQIASAMDYLDKKNVIHGDLATRNVLLQDKNTAKVSDFGLSRKLYQYSNYVKKSQEPLPWRYLALESLRDMQFSSKSDVWAYGVTLWEIFSLGEVPYPGLNWNVDFVTNIENGLRMKRAKFSNAQIYDLQLSCWMNKPEQRPSFSEIQLKLHNQFKSCQSWQE